jgi:hypothetical protein
VSFVAIASAVLREPQRGVIIKPTVDSNIPTDRSGSVSERSARDSNSPPMTHDDISRIYLSLVRLIVLRWRRVPLVAIHPKGEPKGTD